jgi:hypothetical protein
MLNGSRKSLVLAILVIGIGLAVAPLIFQMFSRAPKGGDMIDDFRPYMTDDQIILFRGYMDRIRAADSESREVLEVALVDAGVVDEESYATQFPSVVTLNDEWPGIDADMTDLLDTMDRNLDNFAAVDALPPFSLFPWFFVLPGLLIAGLAVVVLRTRDAGASRRLLWVLAGLGIAVMAAPAVFQMFSRAPKGGDMIDDFRPVMVSERVQGVQGYFITMGGAEGQLRNATVPLALDEGALSESDLPAITEFSDVWPEIVADFAPMVATMVDNVDNFEAVDALPPFPLFPWFFVIPGALVAGLAVTASTRTPAEEPD